MLRLIAEIGSTHNCNLAECMMAIENAAECGIHDVKFQLLEKEHFIGNGNIPLPWEWLFNLVKLGESCGVNVFASCWSATALKVCRDAGCRSVKFAYSCRDKTHLHDLAIDMFDEVFISTNNLEKIEKNKVKNLFCIPVYPVEYLVDFDNVVRSFDGFSDHTTGINQTIYAANKGVKIIEKHVNQCNEKITPDSRFAISWDEVKEIRRECSK